MTKPDLNNLSYIDRAHDFMETYGLDEVMIRSVVQHPDTRMPDPSMAEKGYPVYRFRRGDVSVVVGFKDPTNPHVFFMYVHDPDDGEKQNAETRSGSISTNSKIPKTMTGLKGLLQSQGCRLQAAGTNTKVYYGNVFIVTLHSTTHTQGRTIGTYYNDAMTRLRAAKAVEKLKNQTKEKN